MQIELKQITIREVFSQYENDEEDGVYGYSGKLNIRPKYQREFVYKDAQRNSVIETVRKGFPLNVMYWAKNSDDTFEVLDGQQRTISICSYVAGDFSVNGMAFHNLTNDQKEDFLDYPLMVYFCEGKDSEKLDWFQTINIAGAVLTDQELRNAIYTGAWLTDAKSKFSKRNCAAYNLANKYLEGDPIRQDYLETVLKWISKAKTKDDINDFMALSQNKPNADELWVYFQRVIAWVQINFPDWRKEMRGVEWGLLYNDYHTFNFNPTELKEKVSKYMKDEDVTKKSGIYPYLITGKEKYLSIRAFSDSQKRETFERQKGVCPHCKDTFKFEEMEGDHIKPWHEGGPTKTENCQMLCKDCNRTKSGK